MNFSKISRGFPTKPLRSGIFGYVFKNDRFFVLTYSNKLSTNIAPGLIIDFLEHSFSARPLPLRASGLDLLHDHFPHSSFEAILAHRLSISFTLLFEFAPQNSSIFEFSIDFSHKFRAPLLEDSRTPSFLLFSFL